ncbi:MULTISPECIES: hydrolase [Halomonadaceae]|jgi:predicted alpha/beta-fold hydrolase|uniref:hydrolase n=1 Tax=Halomonadaceae TaxID=28256 RepID=UPI000A28BD8A|nr:MULTISPECIES: hydrolase [Halomonas]MCW4147942.1 hydrolase [Halomonas sp. 18H]MDR5885575.1 hydrolase [Halomonas janggokensis]
MSSFSPSRWLPGGHLQTLYSPLFRSELLLARERERMTLKDGDFLDLDWYGRRDDDTPCVILLHGLTGSSSSRYILGQQQALALRGWQSVAVNWRGCSGQPNQLARGYHSGVSDDLAEVVGMLSMRRPAQPLAAIGYSLGGNVLLKYLGEQGSATPLQAAAAVSVPFRLDHSAERIRQGMSKIYQARFLRDLGHYMKDKRQRFSINGDPDEYAKLLALGSLKGMSTLWEFDERVTAPLHGFSSAADYYQRCSSLYFVSSITVPTLIIQAQDDPFLYPESAPPPQSLPSSVTLEFHRQGGHVGFIEGTPRSPGYYLERRLPAWLASTLSNAEKWASCA